MAPTNDDVPQCFETNLKEFLKYLVEIKEKFPYDDVSINWEGGDGEGEGGGVAINHIPWTDKESEMYRRRLRFFAKAMGEKMDRLAQDNRFVLTTVEEIKNLIRATVNGQSGGNDINRINALILQVSNLLRAIQPVDLEKLIKLMNLNQLAGSALAGKDVILLCGASKSGKTTTLHHLAGTKFKKVERSGLAHLQPTFFIDPSIADFKTSCDEEAETTCIQTATVKMNGVDVVICDTPAFDELEAAEEQIANGLGIARAVHRAKTVRPVLLLSRDGIGHRFNSFSDTLTSVTRLIGNERVDWRTFNYAFTKYDKVHRTSLCRQFILVKKNPPDQEETKASYVRLLDDLIRKTTPEANVVLPLDGSPQLLFRAFLNDTPVIADPERYFVPFVPEKCLEKLKLQLQITLRDVMSALVEEDYVTALFRIQQLDKLAGVLPEASDCSRLGFEAAARHVSFTREKMLKSIDSIKNVMVHKTFTQLCLDLKSDMENVMRSEELRVACGNFEREPRGGGQSILDLFAVCKPKAGTSESFCIDQVQQLTKYLTKDIPEFKLNHPGNTEVLMRNRGSILTSVVRLKELSENLGDSHGGPRVATLYKMIFAQFYAFVDCALSEAEEDFDNLVEDIQSFERQAWFLAVLIHGFLNKPDTGGGEHVKMEKLERRRQKLMLSLDLVISDTMELVSNTKFPDCDEDDDITTSCRSHSLPMVMLSGLRKPRHVLVSVTRVPRMCKFLPSQIDSQVVMKAVDMLDRSIIIFLAKVVLKAESVMDQVNDMMEKGEEPAKVMNIAERLTNDLIQAGTEFACVRGWSSKLAAETDELWIRLTDVKNSIDELLKTLEERIAQLSTRFTCGVFQGFPPASPGYWCK